MKVFLAAALLLLSAGAAAQDYDREQRWAAEIVPGLVVGDAVRLRLPSGRDFLGLYTEAKGAKTAIVLVHGIGVHPDHSIIGTLRAALADEGYATLSLQMPVLAAEEGGREAYRPLFPEAAARIQAGADWLAAKGYARVVLLSHSLGSAMAGAYFERTMDAPFAAWICMGLSGPFGRMGNVKLPVLDVYGEHDLASVLRADWRRKVALDALPGSAQARIPGANHFYAGREKELVQVLKPFLARIK